jgi:hypothetical protein
MLQISCFITERAFPSLTGFGLTVCLSFIGVFEDGTGRFDAPQSKNRKEWFPGVFLFLNH